MILCDIGFPSNQLVEDTNVTVASSLGKSDYATSENGDRET